MMNPIVYRYTANVLLSLKRHQSLWLHESSQSTTASQPLQIQIMNRGALSAVSGGEASVVSDHSGVLFLWVKKKTSSGFNMLNNYKVAH